MASAEKSELTHQLTTSHSGYELVVTPLLLGLLGLWLDSKLGWTPALTVALAVFGVVGAGASFYLRYRHQMGEATGAVLEHRNAKLAARTDARDAAAAQRAAERAALQAELDAAEAAFHGRTEGQMV
ncbi:MAG: hypothetical protein GX868_05815 [Actinobacteria bacterium]|nr:hypothetical protein [Actinomycetota bacterium]